MLMLFVNAGTATGMAPIGNSSVQTNTTGRITGGNFHVAAANPLASGGGALGGTSATYPQFNSANAVSVSNPIVELRFYYGGRPGDFGVVASNS